MLIWGSIFADCVDLLTKVLVVDPKKRATLSQVRNHPWMNKGYDEPIHNHIPHRQPLTSIDMEIVEGMGGFGFGDPAEIRAKLETIIANSDYQRAASQVDQNYQQQLMNQSHSSRPRWRRSLRNKRSSQVEDDPQSLPDMYDPLVSIYYLVKEKKEYDKRQQQLKRAQQAAAQSTPSLRRSSSTITARTRFETNLTRRKTDRVPSTSKLDTPAQTNGLTRSGSVNFPTRSNSERVSSTLLKRSKSAARRLGAMLPNSNIHRHSIEDPAEDKALPPLPTPPTEPANGKDINVAPVPSLSTPLKKTFQQFLKVDPAASRDSDGDERKHRSTWRRLSISRGSKHARASTETNAETSPNTPKSRVSDSVEAKGKLPWTVGSFPMFLMFLYAR